MQKGEPMDDLISRQAASSIPILPKEHRKAFRNEDDAFETGWNEALACVNELPSVCSDLSDYCDRLWKLAYERGKAEAEPKTGRDCTDFVRWLMDEVMDEENWQMNAVANGEIICRKLKKLGMLDVVDGYYIKTQETGDMKGW